MCHTAIDNGHLLTVNYDEYNPKVDITADNLYLDVYRLDDQEVYINQLREGYCCMQLLINETAA